MNGASEHATDTVHEVPHVLPRPSPIGPEAGRFLNIKPIKELLNLPKREWLIEGLIQRGDIAIMYGREGIGKTFIALDMCLAVASGIPWHEHGTTSGPVLYFGWEIIEDFRVRIKAWEQAFNIDVQHLPFYADDTMFSLTSRHDVEDVSRGIEAAFRNEWPSMIVIDTFNRYAHEADENSASETGGVFRNLEEWRRRGSTVLLVHHANDKGNTRGSSAIRGAVKTTIKVELSKQRNTLKITNPKQNGSEKHRPFTLPIREIVLPGGESSLALGSTRPSMARASDDVSSTAESPLEALLVVGQPFGLTGFWNEKKSDLKQIGISSKATLRRRLDELKKCGKATSDGDRGQPKVYEYTGGQPLQTFAESPCNGLQRLQR